MAAEAKLSIYLGTKGWTEADCAMLHTLVAAGEGGLQTCRPWTDRATVKTRVAVVITHLVSIASRAKPAFMSKALLLVHGVMEMPSASFTAEEAKALIPLPSNKLAMTFVLAVLGIFKCVMSAQPMALEAIINTLVNLFTEDILDYALGLTRQEGKESPFYEVLYALSGAGVD